MAETLPIPPISLSGRVPPTNSVTHLDVSAAHVDLTLWPDFHNGTAAALRVGPAATTSASAGASSSGAHQTLTLGAGSGKGNGSGGGRMSQGTSSSKVTRNWIMYNRTASQAKPGGEATHAGREGTAVS